MGKQFAFRADDWVLITPSDVSDISSGRPEALEVTVAGDLAMRSGEGNDITITVAVGPLPYRPVRILSTGTTATVYGLY